MKLSNYNYLKKGLKGGYILFNTFSGCILKITDTTYSCLKDNFKKLNNEEIMALKELGVIIPKDIDEKAIIDYDRSKGIYSIENATFRILTTTLCNARCFYCYEEGISPCCMTMKTADKVIEFIRKKTKNSKKIKIQWFGGEPSLNPDVMYHITTSIIKYCEKNNKEYEFSMITNGSLIKQLDLEKLKLNRVQISVDGDEIEYNLRKNYYDKNITLDTIIHNINLLTSKRIFVSIRLNYDKDNYESIKSLCEYLSNNLVDKNRIRVYPYPLFGTYNGHIGCENGSTSDQLYNLYSVLDREGLLNKEKALKLSYRKSRCFACNVNSFVIDANGELYKCTTDLKKNIGSVFDGVKLNESYFKWCNNRLVEECEKCIFLPICQGGCMAGHINTNAVKCFLQKEIIDKVLDSYIDN